MTYYATHPPWYYSIIWKNKVIDLEKGDTKFNMGVDRIKWIAQISNYCGKAYNKMLKNPNSETVRETANMLDTLLFELRHQISDEDKIEDIQDEIDETISKVSQKDSYNAEEIKKIKKKLRSIRKKLGDEMKNEGIDIPREVEFDEDSAWEQGSD